MMSSGYSILFIVAAALASPVSAASPAASDDRAVVHSGGVTLEVTAPRADVLRVRFGRPVLPEDASWAVRPEARGAHSALRQSREGRQLTVRTDALRAVIDTTTLRIDIFDASGRALLRDAGSGHYFADGGFTLRKELPEDEHFFGLGDKAGALDHRGQSFVLWNTDAFGFGSASDPLYKSVPFFLAANESGQAYGFLLDNTWRTNFDFGHRDAARLEISAPGGPVDYYVIAGPSPRQVVEGYGWLTGTAPLMPMWALGFQQSHWGYHTQAQAQAVADRLRADRIPADVLYLDIDYLDRYRVFTTDKERFPDLPGFVRHLTDLGMHLVLITDLHIPRVTDGSYAPYLSGEAAGIFVQNPNGSEYIGKVWPGDSVFPDFSMPRARSWWGERYGYLVDMGVHGFWNDMNEPAIFEVRSKTMPLDAVHRIEEPGFKARNATHAEIHNVFGMLNARATYEGNLKLAPDVRPFVLTRASFAGGQRYSATWTGDNQSTWEHLHLSVNQLVNLGLSGFAYAGDDIGGFAGQHPPAELLTRWIEIGAFNPIFRDHYDNQKPAQEVWVDGPQQEDIRRRYIEARYELMPYLYTTAETNSRTGLPIMRPVFLEFPAALAKSNSDFDGSASQFMLGGALLVAPPTHWESPQPYKITLPGVGWYDYWTGQRIDSRELRETPQLERLPVFVRPGTILPKQPLVQSTSQAPAGPLLLEVYPGPDCVGSIYQDDGTTLAYQRGASMRQSFRCIEQADDIVLEIGDRQGSYLPWWSGLEVVLRSWGSNEAHATLAGLELPTRITAGVLHIQLPDQRSQARVLVTRGSAIRH
jgi:alpha-glucosidase